MKTDLLDSLFGFRDALSSVIISTSPTDPSQQPTFQTLLQQRDRLTGTINQLIETEFKDATQDLSDAIGKVDAATAQMKGVANTIAGIQQAISITDTVVKTVASVLALVG